MTNHVRLFFAFLIDLNTPITRKFPTDTRVLRLNGSFAHARIENTSVSRVCKYIKFVAKTSALAEPPISHVSDSIVLRRKNKTIRYHNSFKS